MAAIYTYNTFSNLFGEKAFVSLFSVHKMWLENTPIGILVYILAPEVNMPNLDK